MHFDHTYLGESEFICFAHRGGSDEHLENTQMAFSAAVALGYRFIETDVQATSDGTVVVFHDDVLDALTDATGVISQLPYSAVARARTGGTEPVMTLQQALETFPETHFNIDVKTDHAVEPTLDVIRRMDAFDRVCLAAFSDKRLNRLRALSHDKACIGAGPKDVTALKFASWGAPARRLAVHCAQVPMRAYGIALVTPRFLRQCARQGIAVHVWTINEATDMRRLIRLGVNGIMSDRPSLLKQVAIEEGVW